MTHLKSNVLKFLVTFFFSVPQALNWEGRFPQEGTYCHTMWKVTPDSWIPRSQDGECPQDAAPDSVPMPAFPGILRPGGNELAFRGDVVLRLEAHRTSLRVSPPCTGPALANKGCSLVRNRHSHALPLGRRTYVSPK